MTLYAGKVRGFLKWALPELRKCAMKGWTLQRDADKIRQALLKAKRKSLCESHRGPKLIA